MGAKYSSKLECVYSFVERGGKLSPRSRPALSEAHQTVGGLGIPWELWALQTSCRPTIVEAVTGTKHSKPGWLCTVQSPEKTHPIQPRRLSLDRHAEEPGREVRKAAVPGSVLVPCLSEKRGVVVIFPGPPSLTDHLGFHSFLQQSPPIKLIP